MTGGSPAGRGRWCRGSSPESSAAPAATPARSVPAWAHYRGYEYISHHSWYIPEKFQEHFVFESICGSKVVDLYWILDIEISDAGNDQLRRPVAAPAHRRGAGVCHQLRLSLYEHFSTQELTTYTVNLMNIRNTWQNVSDLAWNINKKTYSKTCT